MAAHPHRLIPSISSVNLLTSVMLFTWISTGESFPVASALLIIIISKPKEELEDLISYIPSSRTDPHGVHPSIPSPDHDFLNHVSASGALLWFGSWEAPGSGFGRRGKLLWAFGITLSGSALYIAWPQCMVRAKKLICVSLLGNSWVKRI